MEFIVIDSRRLKIMLSGEELSSYGIDEASFDPEDVQTKRILYDIIDRARRGAGIDGAAFGTFVQVFASKDGGCEMYVTDYSQLGDDDFGGEELMAEDVFSGVRKRKQVYRFEGVRELLLACRALSLHGYDGPSDAYISDSGETYLVLTECERGSLAALEFGDSVFFGGMMPYIYEHTRPVREGDAVGVIGELCPSTYY